MLQLAAKRLAPFSPRATVGLASDAPRLPLPDATVDRFIATYVFDLLAHAEQQRLLAEAARVLQPDGLLCLAGITPGVTPLSRRVMAVWEWLFQRNPRWVGGCRPTRATHYLPSSAWQIRYRTVVVAWGVASEVIIASPVQQRVP